MRRWKESDLEPFAELNADPSVMEFMPRRLTQAESDALVERIEAHFAAEGFGLWALEVRRSGAFVGFTGLAPAHFEAHFTPAVEVGWRLARDAWGHGYATEAARAAIHDGFERLGLTEVVSFTAEVNTRSRRVMERLGMTRSESEDFDHPALDADDPLCRHVLHRLPAPQRPQEARAGATPAVDAPRRGA